MWAQSQRLGLVVLASALRPHGHEVFE